MLALGSLLALLSGTLNAGAAALEKHEGMRAGTGRAGLRLLAVLARRPLWLLAILLSMAAWVAEAASLALAPVPVVATLRNAGRGLLVVGGSRWLDEQFTALEVLGVALASAGGILTAIGAAHSAVSHRPLANLTDVAVAAVCVLGAALVAGLASRLTAGGRPGRAGTVRAGSGEVGTVQVGTVRAGSGEVGPGQAGAGGRQTKAAGVATGAAVGLLYAGTGVFTKEIGDRFALYGPGALTSVLASASPWLMVAMSIWAQSLVQQAFRRANAASISAANASVASLGLIGAGFALYGEDLPGNPDGALLVAGMVVALIGTALLLGSRPAVRAIANPTAPSDRVTE